jgi:hypothetical protein
VIGDVIAVHVAVYILLSDGVIPATAAVNELQVTDAPAEAIVRGKLLQYVVPATALVSVAGVIKILKYASLLDIL